MKDIPILTAVASRDCAGAALKCAEILFIAIRNALSRKCLGYGHELNFVGENVKTETVNELERFLKSAEGENFAHIVVLTDKSMLESEPDNEGAPLIKAFLDMLKEHAGKELVFKCSVIFCHTDTLTDYDKLSVLCKDYGLMYDEFIFSEVNGQIKAAPSSIAIAIGACALFIRNSETAISDLCARTDCFCSVNQDIIRSPICCSRYAQWYIMRNVS